MTLTRRKTLKILGGGMVLAAAAGGYAVTRTPETATAPWDAAGAYDDPRLFALSHAILAPNPHNRQPWMVRLDGEDGLTLFVDTDRLLPHTDPFSRQIVVGLGCFLETLAIAAAEKGLAVEIDPFPEGEDAEALDRRPVATCRFRSGADADPLFDFIPHRRSLKEPYDTALPVADDTLAALEAAVLRGSGVASTNAPDDIEALREMTVAAFEVEFVTPRTYKESVDLFRIGRREVDANPDGIDLSGPFFEALHLTRQFTREKALNPEGFLFSTALDMVRDTARTGMGYIWLTTAGDSRAEQIISGRDWMRLNLAATAQGLGVQPMSQALQEFLEMAELYNVAHGLMAPGGGTVQMLGRLGYGPDVPQSPRWPLEEKLLNA